MSPSYKRLCALLAVTRFSKNELAQALVYLQGRSINDLLADIERVEKSFKTFDDHANEDRSDKTAESTEFAKQVTSLLIREANLSKREAADLLRRELIHYTNRDIPAVNKLGFEAWLDKLARHASQSEILHLANIIRNRRVHSPSDDWLA